MKKLTLRAKYLVRVFVCVYVITLAAGYKRKRWTTGRDERKKIIELCNRRVSCALVSPEITNIRVAHTFSALRTLGKIFFISL